MRSTDKTSYSTALGEHSRVNEEICKQYEKKTFLKQKTLTAHLDVNICTYHPLRPKRCTALYKHIIHLFLYRFFRLFISFFLFYTHDSSRFCHFFSLFFSLSNFVDTHLLHNVAERKIMNLETFATNCRHYRCCVSCTPLPHWAEGGSLMWTAISGPGGDLFPWLLFPGCGSALIRGVWARALGGAATVEACISREQQPAGRCVEERPQQYGHNLQPALYTLKHLLLNAKPAAGVETSLLQAVNGARSVSTEVIWGCGRHPVCRWHQGVCA